MKTSSDRLNPRQERFAQQYVIDGNGTRAAITAGYAEGAAHVQATRLLKDAKVKARIAELQAEAAKRNAVTIDGLLTQLAQLRDEARAGGQMGPAIRAEELRGKTIGAFVDKHLVTTVESVSDELLMANLARTLGDGDRVQERKIFRNLLGDLPAGSFEPRTELTNAQIDKILDGGETLH